MVYGGFTSGANVASSSLLSFDTQIGTWRNVISRQVSLSSRHLSSKLLEESPVSTLSPFVTEAHSTIAATNSVSSTESVLTTESASNSDTNLITSVVFPSTNIPSTSLISTTEVTDSVTSLITSEATTSTLASTLSITSTDISTSTFLPSTTPAVTTTSTFPPNTCTKNTSIQFDYKSNFVGPISNINSFTFSVTARRDAYIALSSDISASTSWEILLGASSNALNYIRSISQGLQVIIAAPVLNETVHKSFWVSWSDSFLRVGTGSIVGQFEFMKISLLSNVLLINYLFISTSGTPGYWTYPCLTSDAAPCISIFIVIV